MNSEFKKVIDEKIDLTLDQNKVKSWKDLAQWILNSYNYIKESKKSFGLKLNLRLIKLIEVVVAINPTEKTDQEQLPIEQNELKENQEIQIIDLVNGSVTENKDGSKVNPRKRKNNDLSYEWVNRRSNRVQNLFL